MGRQTKNDNFVPTVRSAGTRDRDYAIAPEAIHQSSRVNSNSSPTESRSSSGSSSDLSACAFATVV